MPTDIISVLVDEPMGTARGALPSLSGAARTVIEISTDSLSTSLKDFIARFQDVLDEDTTCEKSAFSVDQIELSLAVNGQGGVELIGRVTAGVTASIKLTFKRRTEPKVQ